MCKVDVKESLLIGAPADKVFKVLADPQHHIRILPDEFSNYRDQGNSTVAFTVKAFGTTRNVNVRVEHIEPNRRIRETDIEKGTSLEFLLEPHADGTIVTISTHYKTPLTVAGVIEFIFAPAFLHRIYKEELVLLGRYVLVANI